MNFTAKDVAALREKTGCGMTEDVSKMEGINREGFHVLGHESLCP